MRAARSAPRRRRGSASRRKSRWSVQLRAGSAKPIRGRIRDADDRRMTFPAMELYAMPATTQTLLDDAVVDIE
jgi:hypothetical protein